MKIEDTFHGILEISTRNPMPISARMLKLSEETGELSEAVNFHQGWLPHKTMKEPLLGEVADVIIQALDVAKAAHPDMSHEDLLTLIFAQLEYKSSKWESILDSYK